VAPTFARAGLLFARRGQRSAATSSQPKNSIAETFTRPAQMAEFGDGRVVEPHIHFILGRGRVLETDATERHGAGDGVKRGLGDGDADHAIDIGAGRAVASVT
jgi:hypothetical protein